MNRFALKWSLLDGMHVVARDRSAKRVLVGGLGILGVGQMWFPEYGYQTDLPGFEDAPEAEDGSCPRG